jgi:hypothetical protein
LIDATSTLFCSFWQVICFFLNGNCEGWIYGESFIAFLVNTPGNALLLLTYPVKLFPSREKNNLSKLDRKSPLRVVWCQVKSK